jgi:cathepsin L
MNTRNAVIAMGATAALTATTLHFVTATGETEFLEGADYKFMDFVSNHGRSYGTKAEFQFRSKIFKTKLAEIEAFNAAGNTSRVAVNMFTDRTASEMKKMNGYLPSLKNSTNAELLDTTNLEAEVDWRSKGAVTPVKNQGQCGSCWAFSTTGSVEGAMFLKTGKLQSFSEQQLVDCAGTTGNQGCNGGLMDNAFKYIENAALELEASYPYTGRDGSCHYESSKGVGTVVNYKDVTRNSPAQLKAAIALAPVSIAIEADQTAFQSYTSGVLTTGCGTQLDHGVLAVGYGTEGGQEYFLVKNSWGPSWGDAGYIKIGAGQSNVCGILSSASYPTE